jgi:glutamate--cysteine ligase
LIEVVESGQTAAERKLVLFHGEWQGDIDRVFREFAY